MPETAPAHAAVVLAAGGSRRLGRSKQLIAHAGEALVHRAARLALATGPACALVVLGAGADAVRAAIADLDVRCVDCPDWQRGMGASLRVGLAALPPGIAAALIVVCDQPALEAAHLRRLVHAWHAQPQRAAASLYAGRLGVPALLPRAWFGALDGGDRGARELLARRSGEVAAIADERLALDIDHPADLARLGDAPAR